MIHCARIISTQWFTKRNHEWSNICGLIEKNGKLFWAKIRAQGGLDSRKKNQVNKSSCYCPYYTKLIIFPQWITEGNLSACSDLLRENYLYAVIHCRVMSLQKVSYFRAVIPCGRIISVQWFTAGELSLRSDSLRENHSSLRENNFMVWMIPVTLLFEKMIKLNFL